MKFSMHFFLSIRPEEFTRPIIVISFREKWLDSNEWLYFEFECSFRKWFTVSYEQFLLAVV